MNPILVEIYRGEVLESFHRGVVCIVDRDENVVYSEGNIHQLCYPRSALKFFQQIPMLMSGAAEAFGFSMEEIAIMCGSHNGEEKHVEVVNAILNKIGLNSSDLLCGAQYPSDKRSANRLIAKGEKPGAIHNNCSGKHAGFLAYSVFLGADVKSYLEAHHPTQKEIRRIASHFHSMDEAAMQVALDGCSAPIYAIPVYNQALAYMRLVDPDFGDTALRKASNQVVQAAREFPFMIAGSGRYCSDLIQTCADELIGKTGAEGIYSLAFHKEIFGACIKIDDGKMLPQYNVAQKLVEQSGLFSKSALAPLHHYMEEPLRNFNNWETGTIKVAESILSQPWR
ncbi:MAG TPA: hypothetical protein DIW47_06275 [Bacteroidetes bacterium]|nr:hypothetical protein [Bacteroidota bacterium]